MFDQEGHLSLTEDAPQARALFTGDLCPINRLDGMLVQGDLQGAFGDTLDVFRQADLAVVNLEAPLCDVEAPIDKLGPNFRSDPAVAGALAEVPVRVACLANNHVMDQGAQGLKATLDNLEAAGISHLGARRDQSEAGRPLSLEVKGLRLALLNYGTVEGALPTSGPGAARMDPIRIRRAVCNAAADYDLVIPVLHTGKEEVLFPSPMMTRLCRELVEAGASAVVCHHPHVPQGIEIYRDCPIAYSLGNFLFDWHEPEPLTDTSFLLELELAGPGVSGLRLHPIVKSATGGAKLMSAPAREEYLEFMADISMPLTSPERHEGLWLEQCRRLLGSWYAPRLARGQDLCGDDLGSHRRACLTFLNVLEDWEHGENLRAALLAEVTGGPIADPEAGQYLDDLRVRLEAFARQS